VNAPVNAPDVPTAREVRRRLRRARSAHRDTTLGAILTDVYMVAMAVAIYGALAVTAIRRHLRLPPAGSAAETGVRAWLLVAVALVLGALVWHAVRDLGPLYVTAAARYWAAGTPVDRAGWLRPGLGWVALAGAVGGALFGAGVVLFSGSGWAPSAWWVPLTASAAGAGVPLGAVVAQAAAATPAGIGRHAGASGAPDGSASGTGTAARAGVGAPGRGAGVVVAGLGLAIAFGVVALDAWGVGVPVPPVPVPVLAVVAVGVAVWAGVAALRRLGRLDAAALTGGAQLADAATVSLVLLQPAMFSDIIEIRRWRRVGSVHSGPLGPPPSIVVGGDRIRRVWTLVRADLRRQSRRPAGLLAWTGLLIVPYAMATVASGAAAPARVVAGYLATERMCAGLRVACRSAALRRLLGGSNAVLRSSHLVVPAVALAVWWPATLPAVSGAGWAEPLLGLGVLGAAYRAATRRPTRYDGAAVDTPFGIVQPDLVTQIVRGPDLVAGVALAAFVLA
jgi:hypothetical protein